ncbi:sensor histidine kinase, partial [Rhodovulum sulfidophilum]|nr:hypothetical protein [Rhodovulum sulfidophilum]
QMLTATAALTASIGLAAPPEHPALARDAEAIGANIRAMMTCLRGAFARLRPPDLDEVGLLASLRGMLSGWQTQSGARLRLDSTLDEDGLSGAVALDLYRIVQECVTNAMRHGTPSRVDVALHAEGDLRARGRHGPKPPRTGSPGTTARRAPAGWRDRPAQDPIIRPMAEDRDGRTARVRRGPRPRS